ncbi:MAG TPA: DUF2721 domain-containing protein [Capsulimonadaceae bacterium]|nr:DUF2721 domain-containing protein [Capsulimonadaceae bacterium]
MSPQSGLLSLISAAVAPVVLITAGAILLSGFSAKYASISEQMRHLAAEYRGGGTSEGRRNAVRLQLVIFGKRGRAIWAASTFQCLAILSFLMMVLAVIFSQHAARLGALGVGTLVVGLVFMVISVLCELEELRLARTTAACELSDTIGDDAVPGPRSGPNRL